MKRIIETIILMVFLIINFVFLGIAISIGNFGEIILFSIGVVMTVTWIVEYHLRKDL